MRLNIDRDLVKQLVSRQLPNKSRHLNELTHEPTIHEILFSGYPALTAVN